MENKNNMNEFINKDALKLESVNNTIYSVRWDDDIFVCPPQFEELLGYSKEIINKFPFKHHSLIPDGQGEPIHNSIIHSKVTPKEMQFDFEIFSEDGQTFWFREIVTEVETEKGKYNSLLFNISDFKKRELELSEKSNELEELNKSKDKLISIISHDLRAPFSSLLGFSEILLNEPNLTEEERTEYLKYIYDASNLQLQMVNHLLDLTRLQTGNIKFEPKRLDIKDVIDSCVSVLTGSVIRKNIEIKVIGEPGFYVTADERLISQAITNLLSNAVKFTPSGKKIFVKLGLFKDDLIEVIVEDEGTGIEEKHHDKLFKIDAKYSKTGTEGEKGSGFGLTLVKEIVEKHDGKIWFYSELNKGSEFHFTLPKAEDLILILEEYEELQKNYENIIKEKFGNYNIKFCKNGFEALNFLLKKIPSALITYHKMPLMSGIQLVSSLREKDTNNKVNVLVIGDDIPETDILKYNSYNVNNFIKINSSKKEFEIALAKIVY